ncbi:rRNA pseudouridine synthase [Marinilongibacter aquaticus]|uniref:pseudouridine synthase n=1 Tax=Marinilongibacter aquaticus TaxID=2975157 RepID=UPI0021BDEC88|nr:pseudouridine synthase [Marinilongibacter aquaticus]UBM60281.1 rRNA pseudouridine synthase [Marinilongibacter aquaticus]
MDSKDNRNKDENRGKLKTNFKKFGKSDSTSDRRSSSPRKSEDRNFDRGERKFDRDEKKPFGKKDGGFKKFDRDDKKPFDRKEGGFKKFDRDDKKPFDRKEGGFKKFDRDDNKPYGRKEGGFKKFDRDDNKPYGRKEGGFKKFDRDDKKPFDRKEGGFKKFDRDDNKPFDRKEGGFKKFDRDDSKPYGRKEGGFKKFDRDDSKPYGRKEGGFKKFDRDDSKPYGRKEGGFKKFDRDDSKPYGRKEGGFKKSDRDNDRPFGRSEGGFKKFDQTGERQVGMKRPPRYDKQSLHEKAPFKAKGRIRAEEEDDQKEIRLNRYLANAGLCSRREADELIASGMIKVNGKVVTEMGYKVLDSDTVTYGKNVLSRERMMYILLNKPKDYITTMDDPDDRKTVMDLVGDACKERIYPVGRLDRNTTGLILLTNDGELTEKLTHPSSEVKKIYQAELNKPLDEEHFLALKEGIELEDGFIKPDQLAYVTPDAEVIGIEIHSGRNRIVRRIFEHFGYEVQKLDRTTFASLNKKDLPRGKWRYLSEKEVIMLKYLL